MQFYTACVAHRYFLAWLVYQGDHLTTSHQCQDPIRPFHDYISYVWFLIMVINWSQIVQGLPVAQEEM